MKKEKFSTGILCILDLLAIVISVILATATRNIFASWFGGENVLNLMHYLTFYPLYVVVIFLLVHEGIYNHRYDFWHESRIVIKVLITTLIIVLAYLALSRSIEEYSRFIIVLAFFYMSILIPVFKNISKKLLFKLGFWQKRAYLHGEDDLLSQEIFSNPYLGYILADHPQTETVFVSSKSFAIDSLLETIDQEISLNHEVIFTPPVNDYDLTQAHIYNMLNIRTNAVILQNRLKSKYRLSLKEIFDYMLAIILLPVLLPVIIVLAIMIKKESPGPIFFAHNRIGKNGKIIPTLKFRSMYIDAKERLEELLSNDEEKCREWKKNFKLKNDPRVTQIGSFMRKTSLDELPQVFNVLKGEMSFVGPRPVIQQEIDQYYKKNAKYYFMMKPGITGLWQVSGRSETGYEFRVNTDKWYVKNWSPWLDIAILIKTVKVVLLKDGAY